MMKTVKEHNIKADDVAEIKVEVIARAADILGDPGGLKRRLQAAVITDPGYNRFWREAMRLLGWQRDAHVRSR